MDSDEIDAVPVAQLEGRKLRWVRLALVIASLGAGLSGLVAWRAGQSQSVAASVRSIEVPVSVLGRLGGAPGGMPVVDVRVGGGQPLRVLLDTGATGLHVLSGAVGSSNFSVLRSRGTATWGDGNITSETLAIAKLSIGGVTTTHPVRFGVVNSVGCRTRACPSWAGTRLGIVGTLGVSLRPETVTPNPLLSLPRPFSASWRIALSGSHGTLELGAPIPARPVAVFKLPASPVLDNGSVRDNGAASGLGVPQLQPTWPAPPSSAPGFTDGAPTACWQVETLSSFTCLPTVFDSGSTDNAAFPDAAFLSGRGALRPGQHVSVWQNSTSRTPFWSFTTGTAASVNIVRVGTGPVVFMIAGVPAFYNFAVTFDAARGELLLSRPSASAATQTSHRAVPSSPWQRGAGELCTRLGHQAAIASQVGPSTPSNQSLRRKALALAFRLNTWARASLHTDRLLLQLRPPRALASKWRAAIVSDQAGATIMLRFARAASTYRTETAYERAVRRFAARYHAAEQTWSTVIAQIGMTACT